MRSSACPLSLSLHVSLVFRLCCVQVLLSVEENRSR